VLRTRQRACSQWPCCLVDCPKRVLLTGTPIQNNLDEYAAVMDFACPGLLGPIADFHRRFTLSIQRGSEPAGASTHPLLSLT